MPTPNQTTTLSDEVCYHLDIQHPIFLLSIFLCISRVGAKTALGGKTRKVKLSRGLEAARAHSYHSPAFGWMSARFFGVVRPHPPGANAQKKRHPCVHYVADTYSLVLKHLSTSAVSRKKIYGTRSCVESAKITVSSTKSKCMYEAPKSRTKMSTSLHVRS